MALFYNPKTMTPEARIAHVKHYLSAYGESHKVDFSFTETPKTDGRTVWLGALDASCDTFLADALAHGMHEMLHVTDTTMEVFSDAKLEPLVKLLLNVLEDVRIDALGMKRYPGYAAWRADLAERLETHGKLRAAKPPETLEAAELFCTWLHAALMAKLHTAWAEHHVNALCRELLKHLNHALLEQILCVAQKCVSGESTAQILSLSRRIVKLLHDYVQCTENETPEPDLFSANPRNASFIRTLEENCGKTPWNFATPEVNTQAIPLNPPSEATQSPQVVDWPDSSQNPRLREDAIEYGKLFAAQQTACHRLTQAFRQLLRVEQPIPIPSREGCDLSEDFVERIATRDDRIFLQEASRLKVDADIIVLLDRSGSMGLERMTLAKVAVGSFIDALAPLQSVESQVAVFPGPQREHLALLKHRKETLDRFMKRLSGVGAFGATPLVQSLHWALQDLSHSRHSLKLVVLITDGAYPANRVEETRAAFEQARIDLAVMNIDTENEPLSTNCVNVVASEAIAPGLLRLVQHTVLGRWIRRNSA